MGVWFDSAGRHSGSRGTVPPASTSKSIYLKIVPYSSRSGISPEHKDGDLCIIRGLYTVCPGKYGALVHTILAQDFPRALVIFPALWFMGS